MVFPGLEELAPDVGQTADQLHIVLFDVAGIGRVAVALQQAGKL